MMRFKNKNVLITGGSRGIGRETAIAFAKEGARVAFNYKNNSDLAEETISLMPGGPHKAYQLDLCDASKMEQIFMDILNDFGHLDILVNNAGIAIHHPLDDISFESWQEIWKKIIDTNLTAVSNSCYLAAQHMIKQGGGRIVNVSSRGAFRGEPAQPAYGASKAGLNALSQSLAKQLGPNNIYVHVVAPGFVDTDMTNEFLNDDERKLVENESPLGRMAKPEEVAAAILYLASDDSAFSTGAILDINGASYLRT